MLIMVHENRIYIAKNLQCVKWTNNLMFYAKTISLKFNPFGWDFNQMNDYGIVMAFAADRNQKKLKKQNLFVSFFSLRPFYMCYHRQDKAKQNKNKTKERTPWNWNDGEVNFIFGLIFRSFDSRWLVSCWFSLKPNVAISCLFVPCFFRSSIQQVTRFHSLMRSFNQLLHCSYIGNVLYI